MPKKPTKQQKNKAKLDQLLKQRVSTSTGFLNNDFKKFIAEELIHSYNNQNKTLKGNESLQSRYNKFKKYYDKLFTTGMTGHAQFTGSIEKNFRKDIEKGTEYFIRENGVEHKVSYSELAYKMELFAHKMSAKHDVAFTKFKPTYYLIGKGKYKVVINIPNTKGMDEMLDESTTEEIMEWFDSENVEVVISDPSRIKTKDERVKYEKAKKARQTKIRKAKEKHYKQWKKGKGKKKK